MKAIVIGADSGIGSALITAMRGRGVSVLGTTRRPIADIGFHFPLDLASAEAGYKDFPVADIAFFCAAITNFAECRRDPQHARQVNVTAPLIIARRMVEVGTRVVFLSTNAVFDAHHSHVAASTLPCPASVYGRLKAEAEAGFGGLGNLAAIVRLGKVLTPASKLFRNWITTLGHNRQIVAFADMRMAPISLDEGVGALLAVAKDAGSGIYQLSGARDISYAEAARYLATQIGADANCIVEERARDVGIPTEEIMFHSTLDSSRVSALTGQAPPEPFTVLDHIYHNAIEAAKARSTGLR